MLLKCVPAIHTFTEYSGVSLCKSLAGCKITISSLLTQWRYCSFALSHRYSYWWTLCHKGAGTKGPLFCRQHFWLHFLERMACFDKKKNTECLMMIISVILSSDWRRINDTPLPERWWLCLWKHTWIIATTSIFNVVTVNTLACPYHAINWMC